MLWANPLQANGIGPRCTGSEPVGCSAMTRQTNIDPTVFSKSTTRVLRPRNQRRLPEFDADGAFFLQIAFLTHRRSWRTVAECGIETRNGGVVRGKQAAAAKKDRHPESVRDPGTVPRPRPRIGIFRFAHAVNGIEAECPGDDKNPRNRLDPVKLRHRRSRVVTCHWVIRNRPATNKRHLASRPIAPPLIAPRAIDPHSGVQFRHTGCPFEHFRDETQRISTPTFDPLQHG